MPPATALSPAVKEIPLVQRSARRTWSRLAESRCFAVLVLLFLSGFLFFYGLTSGELYRTETLRAIIAAEFLRSGNWIVPVLYGEPLFTKPPGMYAAIALASWPLGHVTEWTARLPSALAATFTVFLVYWYFGRQLGRRAGLVAAALLPLSFMWLDKAPAAEIDMLQLAWVAAAIICFLQALEIEEAATPKPRNPAPPRPECIDPTASPSLRLSFSPSLPLSLSSSPRLWLWWSAALLCVAGGVLTKWTSPAFFYGTVVPLLWWRGRLRLLVGRHHLVCAVLGAGICFAWAGAAVAQTGWHVFYDTVSREALMRLSPFHHHRAYPWRESLAQPFRILAADLPMSLFALFALKPGFAATWDDRGRRLVQALHCWVWPNLLFWSLIPEHAVRQSFPLFPGISGLAALVWIAWLRGSDERAAQDPLLAARRSPLVAPPSVLSAVRPGSVLIAIVGAWLIVKVAFVLVVIPGRNQNRDLRIKAAQIAALVPKEQTLYLFRLKDEGIMFYYGRTVRRVPSPAELPSSDERQYCILVNVEWEKWHSARPAKDLLHLRDGQGDPIVLVQVDGR